MRRHTSAIIAYSFYVLRVTNALSLANFQLVSPSAVSLGCFVEYDTSIATCTLSDFNNGCSLDCQSALTSKATCVKSACSEDNVASNSLLGIVKNGGIIAALCPSIKTSSTTATPTSTRTLSKTSSAGATTTVASVTIPTTSPGVTLSSTSSSRQTSSIAASTSSSSSVVSTAKSTSTIVSSTSQTSSSTSSESTPSDTNTRTTSTTPITESASTSASTSISISTSTKTTATPKSTITSVASAENGDGVSGGGSPFDIDANSKGGVSVRISGGLVLVVGLVGLVHLGMGI